MLLNSVFSSQMLLQGFMLQMTDAGFKAALAKFVDVKMWDEAQKQAKLWYKEAEKKQELAHGRAKELQQLHKSLVKKV